MSARPLAASVAPLALGYDERSAQVNNQHVENPRRRSNGDGPLQLRQGDGGCAEVFPAPI